MGKFSVECFPGKASEYYALQVERNQEMVYMNLIRKLEKRFGFRELPETTQVQFNNARQTPDELLEDWADRVLSLATRAFRDLPETHMYQQAVVRLCQGTADKEAGSYASNIRPKNIEEAIDKMRWFQRPVLQEFIRSLTGIIKLDLGCFGEFSETKPFF
jgi:hypothetical protein